jgi:hypothetical protein
MEGLRRSFIGYSWAVLQSPSAEMVDQMRNFFAQIGASDEMMPSPQTFA